VPDEKGIIFSLLFLVGLADAFGFVAQPHARFACARISASEHAFSPTAFNMRTSTPRLARRATEMTAFQCVAR
jgi:hypothetical protein